MPQQAGKQRFPKQSRRFRPEGRGFDRKGKPMHTKTHNIFFVGLMGAGKTTLGRQLAKQLERPFYDSD